MKKTLSLFITLSLLTLTGCSTFLPKKVELFQSKVHSFPEPTSSQKELQKEVAQRAKEKSTEVLIAARAENASTNIVSPAHEAAELTDALSSSVGAPASRPTESSQALADELRKSVAKLDQKIDKFAASNDKMEGKKVEGTGLIQVPYLAWLGGAIILVLVFWHLAKTALTLASGANPGALVGVAGMNVVGSVVSKGFQQVVKGGEKFKEWIDKEIEDPALKQKVLDAFAVAHKKAQDEDVKTLVDKVIK